MFRNLFFGLLIAVIKVCWQVTGTFLFAITRFFAWILQQQAAPFIAVFSSARNEQQAPALYREYRGLGAFVGGLLAKNGWSILSGGCPGPVSEAQEAFCKLRSSLWQMVVGIRIAGLAYEQIPSPFVDLYIWAAEFGSRLRLMKEVPRHYIFLPGGIGTFLEVGFILQHVQAVRGYRNRRVILVGQCWAPTMDQLREYVRLGTISEADLKLVTWVTNPEAELPGIIQALPRAA